MAIKSNRLGPGHLKLGAVGSELEIGAQCTEVQIKHDIEEGDVIDVLSGEQITEDDEETYTLQAKVLQSYDRSSFIVWAHVHAGEIIPFEFKPVDDEAIGVKGNVKVRRLDIGGKVKQRNESDLEFTGLGTYDLTDNAGAVITEYAVGP